MRVCPEGCPTRRAREMNPEKADTGHAWPALNFPSAPHAPQLRELAFVEMQSCPRARRGHLPPKLAQHYRPVDVMTAYANWCRSAVVSIFSAAGVNREPLTRPMRFKVRRATGSQNSIETPSPNIATTRCSSGSRSVHEIPSIAYLGSSPIGCAMIGPAKLKIY